MDYEVLILQLSQSYCTRNYNLKYFLFIYDVKGSFEEKCYYLNLTWCLNQKLFLSFIPSLEFILKCLIYFCGQRMPGCLTTMAIIQQLFLLLTHLKSMRFPSLLPSLLPRHNVRIDNFFRCLTAHYSYFYQQIQQNVICQWKGRF